MKKIAFLGIILYSTIGLRGQSVQFAYTCLPQMPADVLSKLDQMGLDNTDTLTELECQYLMYRHPPLDSSFSFCGKKVFFSLYCNRKKNWKIGFFKDERDRLQRGLSDGVNSMIYYFDESTKKKYGLEYDIFIDCWDKKIYSTEKRAH